MDEALCKLQHYFYHDVFELRVTPCVCILHMVSPQVVFLTYLPHHAKLQVLPMYTSTADSENSFSLTTEGLTRLRRFFFVIYIDNRY